jgi:hypothetical protein
MGRYGVTKDTIATHAIEQIVTLFEQQRKDAEGGR